MEAIPVHEREASRYAIAAVVLVVVVLGGFFGMLVWQKAEVWARGSLGCNIPGTGSDPGEVHWQWSPPGTYCTLPHGYHPKGAPQTWGGPRPWRWLLVIAGVIAGAAIVGSYLRWPRLDEGQERREAARRRSRLRRGDGGGDRPVSG